VVRGIDGQPTVGAFRGWDGLRRVTVRAMELIESSGSTAHSLRAWEATRGIFGTFQEAILARPGRGDRRYAVSGPGFAWNEGDADAWLSPGMVLRDERGSELWLSGCPAGYHGTGPWSAVYILLKEGFPHEQLRLVFACDPLHLVKGSDPLVAERKPDSSDLAMDDAEIVERLLDAEASGSFSGRQYDDRPD
jgi:hypothetical protein